MDVKPLKLLKVTADLPDLILFYINMPISDGRQFCKTFREWDSRKENVKNLHYQFFRRSF
jgi:CheY-like chemotaxis protein